MCKLFSRSFYYVKNLLNPSKNYFCWRISNWEKNFYEWYIPFHFQALNFLRISGAPLIIDIYYRCTKIMIQCSQSVANVWMPKLNFKSWMDSIVVFDRCCRHQQGQSWALKTRYRLKFFDQVGHETTYASSGNKHFFTK